MDAPDFPPPWILLKQYSALAIRSYGKVHHTRGNLNNHIGLPLTLLRMPATTEVCVLELGMSGFGEIERLAEICRPTIRVITNIAPVHLEGVGGNLEGVARAKGELFATAAAGDVCIVNADDERASALTIPKACSERAMSFGAPDRSNDNELTGSRRPDIVFDDVRSLALREVSFTLRSGGRNQDQDQDQDRDWDHHRVIISEPGAHLAPAAAAAACVATALNLPLSDVCQNLTAYESLEMRMRVKEVPSRGIICIDDAYNASPTSVQNALRTLRDGFKAHATTEGAVADEDAACNQYGRTVVLLGDMLELGSASGRYHEEIIDMCLSYGFDLIGLAGPEFSSAAARVAAARGTDSESESTDTRVFYIGEDAKILWEKIKEDIHAAPGGSSSAVVLVKGSRGMKMDYIVEQLTTTRTEQ